MIQSRNERSWHAVAKNRIFLSSQPWCSSNDPVLLSSRRTGRSYSCYDKSTQVFTLHWRRIKVFTVQAWSSIISNRCLSQRLDMKHTWHFAWVVKPSQRTGSVRSFFAPFKIYIWWNYLFFPDGEKNPTQQLCLCPKPDMSYSSELCGCPGAIKSHQWATHSCTGSHTLHCASVHPEPVLLLWTHRAGKCNFLTLTVK